MVGVAQGVGRKAHEKKGYSKGEAKRQEKYHRTRAINVVMVTYLMSWWALRVFGSGFGPVRP